MDRAVLQRSFAEFVGTFTLIFIGAGSIVATGGHDLTAIAFAHGLAIGVMVSAVGHISGGHFNPAITLGFVVTRRIETGIAVAYWVAQFLGAVVAAAILRGVVPGPAADAVNLGAPALGHHTSAGQGLGIEIILTFFLVWVVFASRAGRPRSRRRPRPGRTSG